MMSAGIFGFVTLAFAGGMVGRTFARDGGGREITNARRLASLERKPGQAFTVFVG